MQELMQVAGDEFSGSVRDEGEKLVVDLRGNADMHAIDPLEHMLERVHADAVRLGSKEIVMDMRELEFMNSSCFKSFVTLVHSAQELEEEKRYKIRLLSNPDYHWQKRSLNALRCFAVDLVTVES